MIRFACPGCGMQLSAPEDCAGRSSKCRACGQAFQIPLPVATLVTAPSSPPIRCQCPRCKQSHEAPAAQAGQKTNCPNCGQRIQVPALPTSPSLNKTMLVPAVEPLVSFFCPTCQGAVSGQTGDKVACGNCGQRLLVPSRPAAHNKTVLGTFEPGAATAPVPPLTKGNPPAPTPEPLWYYSRGDIRNGPVGERELLTLIARGELNPNDMVWTDGMPNWVRAEQRFPALGQHTAKHESPVENSTTRGPQSVWVRWLSPSFLTTSLILFFLPFTHFSCQNKTIATQNAFQAAYGGLSLEIVPPQHSEPKYPRPALFMIFAIPLTFLALIVLWVMPVGRGRQILGLTLVGLTLVVLLAQLAVGWPMANQIREDIQKLEKAERNRGPDRFGAVVLAQTTISYGTATAAYLWLGVLIGTTALLIVEVPLSGHFGVRASVHRWWMSHKPRLLVWGALGGVLLTCLIALVVFLARGGVGSSVSEMLGGAPNGIVNHPWWRGSVSRGQVDRIISEVYRSKPRDIVVIQSNGTFETRKDFLDAGSNLKSLLNGLQDSTEIILQGGCARQDVSRLLKDMLDQAHASEERWRRTGKGNTNLDVIFQNQFEYTDEGVGKAFPPLSGPLSK